MERRRYSSPCGGHVTRRDGSSTEQAEHCQPAASIETRSDAASRRHCPSDAALAAARPRIASYSRQPAAPTVRTARPAPATTSRLRGIRRLAAAAQRRRRSGGGKPRHRESVDDVGGRRVCVVEQQEPPAAGRAEGPRRALAAALASLSGNPAWGG